MPTLAMQVYNYRIMTSNNFVHCFIPQAIDTIVSISIYGQCYISHEMHNNNLYLHDCSFEWHWKLILSSWKRVDFCRLASSSANRSVQADGTSSSAYQASYGCTGYKCVCVPDFMQGGVEELFPSFGLARYGLQKFIPGEFVTVTRCFRAQGRASVGGCEHINYVTWEVIVRSFVLSMLPFFRNRGLAAAASAYYSIFTAFCWRRCRQLLNRYLNCGKPSYNNQFLSNYLIMVDDSYRRTLVFGLQLLANCSNQKKSLCT